MDANPKYDRDKLVDLLAERAEFERRAVGLYDALLATVEKVDDSDVASSIADLRRHRDEEREQAEWLDGLIHQLGGTPSNVLPDAVDREAGVLEETIERKPDGAGLLLPFHAMLAAELMDAEGWKLLLEIAKESGDDAAARELSRYVEREEEHLALVRRLMLSLAKHSVQIGAPVVAKKAKAGKSVQMSGPARATTDHDTIRQWVESRGGSPARVKGTGRKKGDVGMLRIDFPGWSGEHTLEHIDWDSWLRAFDDNGLAFLYEEKMADGRPSRFNKLVARETIRRRVSAARSPRSARRRHA